MGTSSIPPQIERIADQLTTNENRVSRRDLIRFGGPAGLVALAGGTASAADSPSADDDQGHRMHADETFNYVYDGRPLYSTEAQTFYVDPDDGNDANDGSEHAPFRTLSRTYRELPFYNRHGFEIQLARPNPENPYDSSNIPPACLGYVDVGGTLFHILGDTDNPTAYPFTRSKMTVAFNYSHDPPNSMIEGCELGGIGLDGYCFYRDCHITGWETNSTGVTGYGGKGWFRRCTFKQSTYAFGAYHGKLIATRACTFKTDYLCTGGGDMAFIFTKGDPGVPLFESKEAAEESNVYIQTTGSAVLQGPGQLY